jgi:phosphate transport system protein
LVNLSKGTSVERHFEKEINEVMEKLLAMADAVEKAVKTSLQAFLARDAVAAQEVLDNESVINAFEITIDNDIVRFFARQQPVAVDLRLVLAIQKINNELERIGDHAVNIAESAKRCASAGTMQDFPELFRMAETVTTMLANSLQSFFTKDSELARAQLLKDDEIDRMNKAIILKSIDIAKATPGLIEPAIEYIRVSKNLERIADLSTNIAEEEIFHNQARMVKHHTDTIVPPFSN